jgi:hypothetical protein
VVIAQMRRGELPGGDPRPRRVGELLWLLLMLHLWLDTREQPIAWPTAKGQGGEA